MADSIETIVYDRVDSDGDLLDDAKLYVMAALDGTLDEVIEGGTSEGQPPRPGYPRFARRRLLAARIRHWLPRHRPAG